MVDLESQHTTLISVASIAIDALESYGLDSAPIIREAGLDPGETYRPDDRVPTRRLEKLWTLAVKYTADPCFGLSYARYIQPSALHGLGFSWLASHTLKEGLERLVRFQRVLDNNLRLELLETETGYCLRSHVNHPDDPFRFPDAEVHSQIASIYRLCQIMLGPGLVPAHVSFEHAAPDCADRFQRFFGIPVEFEAGQTAIEFDRNTGNSPSSSANPELARINDQVVIDYLDRFDRDDVVTQTRRMIIDRLPSGAPRQRDIAADLNLSLRSFQRKLKQAGTSYSQLLHTVRHEMARSYLQSPQHQIIMIAYMLGYTDPSNFARAFKQWDGLSPKEYRDQSLLL